MEKGWWYVKYERQFCADCGCYTVHWRDYGKLGCLHCVRKEAGDRFSEALLKLKVWLELRSDEELCMVSETLKVVIDSRLMVHEQAMFDKKEFVEEMERAMEPLEGDE